MLSSHCYGMLQETYSAILSLYNEGSCVPERDLISFCNRLSDVTDNSLSLQERTWAEDTLEAVIHIIGLQRIEEGRHILRLVA